MTIRRRQSSENSKRRSRPPLDPCLNTEQALQHGREAVSRVFSSVVGEVSEEIARARTVFCGAENLLSRDGRKIHDVMAACKSAVEATYGKTSAAAAHSESSAKSAVNAMLENLNQITESLMASQATTSQSGRR